MSRLACKSTLLDRLQRPGMVGALGAVAEAAVQSAASAWRTGRVEPSVDMKRRLEDAVPAAEQWLLRKRQASEQRAKVIEPRAARLREVLGTLPHGGCKKAAVTLKDIAIAAEVQYQLLVNFRAGYPMTLGKIEAVEKAVAVLMPGCEAKHEAQAGKPMLQAGEGVAA